MKKVILISLFILSCVMLLAQTGMFNISFGQDYQTAVSSLLKQGFTQTDTTSTSRTFVNSKIPSLAKLQLRDTYSEKKVSGWTMYYRVGGDEAVIKDFKDKLDALHKVTSYYDDYYDEEVWELNDTYAIYFYTLDYDETLVIEYTELSDDDYYYDDDYWY